MVTILVGKPQSIQRNLVESSVCAVHMHHNGERWSREKGWSVEHAVLLAPVAIIK